jgi:tetratricopeptide (TPR) repeat protein
MKMKIWTSLVLLISIFFSSFGQSSSKPTSKSNDPTLIRLEKLLQDNQEEYRQEFISLEKIWNEQRNKEKLAKLYQFHVDYLSRTNSYDSIISTLHHIRGLLQAKPEKESLLIYLKLANNFYHKRNYDSLAYWQGRVEQLIEPNSPHYGSYLLLKGSKSNLEESYVDAIINLLKSIIIFEANEDYKHLAVAYNNLSINYFQLENLEAQQEYLLKAIEINKANGFVYDLINNYNNLGASYRKQNLLEEALAVYDLAYTELKKVKSPMLLAQNLTNRANILEKLGDFKSAEKLFLECGEISESNGIQYGVLLANLNLGNLYRQMKKYDLAKELLDKALVLSKELSVSREQVLIYERLAWLARDQRDFEQAYLFITQYHSLNDSLISESVKKEANLLREKYEAEKKELEIISLSKDKINQQFWIALMGGGLLALLVAVQWWRNKHQLALQERQNQEQSYNLRLELKEKELLADSLKRVSELNTKASIYHDLKELMKDLPKTQLFKFEPILKELREYQDQNMLEEFETRFLGVYENFSPSSKQSLLT